MKQIKLFCLPYAGGSGNIYNQWQQHINNNIEIFPIELAGRGRRFNEPLFDNIDLMTEDVYNKIKDLIEESPYAFFGYSMGSIIAYELIRKIEMLNLKPPMHAFFSAKAPLQLYYKNENIHLLEDNKFITEIMELGGTPKEIFENKELRDIYMEILKCDYKAAESYVYQNGNINCNISILYGKKDDKIAEQIHEWAKLTNCSCTFYSFEGGHFFMHKELDKITNIVNSVF